ncbi:MAG: phenylacetate--CoA ligase, partial [Halobacteriota archaeon]
MECWNPKIERLEAEELQELQERKLQRVVENAFEHSIFYKKRFDQVGVSPRDIETLDDVERL